MQDTISELDRVIEIEDTDTGDFPEKEHKEIEELLKEIAGLIENASAGFQALDKKWSKSQISK